MSGFFHLPNKRSFCRLTRTSRVKSFSSCQTVFPIVWMLISNYSLREPERDSLLFRVPSLICGVFKHFNYLKFLFFPILSIDDRLILVCLGIFLGAKCMSGRSYCEQTNSSIKSIILSIETDLGCLEPCLLSTNQFL